MPKRINSNKLNGVNLAETLVKHRSPDDANSVNQHLYIHCTRLITVHSVLRVCGWVSDGGGVLEGGNFYHMFPCYFSHSPTVVIRFLSLLLPS